MEPELVIFLCLVVALVGGLALFLRKALAEVAAAAGVHAKTYAAAYVKGGALVLMAMIAAFDQAFTPLTADAARALTWWGWAVLFFKPVAAGLAVVVAFLDKTAGSPVAPKA